MNTPTQTTNQPVQKFKSLDEIINALSVAERRAINKKSKRTARRVKTTGPQSHRDVLMWYADWIRQPHHDAVIKNDLAGAWVLIECMKIGPRFLAQQLWTVPAWQRVVQLHLVKKIQRHQSWKLALVSKPGWLSNPDWIAKRHKYFEQWKERATEKKLLQLAQRLCEGGK